MEYESHRERDTQSEEEIKIHKILLMDGGEVAKERRVSIYHSMNLIIIENEKISSFSFHWFAPQFHCLSTPPHPPILPNNIIFPLGNVLSYHHQFNHLSLPPSAICGVSSPPHPLADGMRMPSFCDTHL